MSTSVERFRGRLIAFEGIDGSGKSTQARLLAEALSGRGLDVLLTQEPAGTPLGELVKGVFERSHSEAGAPPLSAETELFLFEAAGIILLVAMIGAIVLTHRQRSGVRGQNVSRQVARRPDEATVNMQPEVGKGVQL